MMAQKGNPYTPKRSVHYLE